MKNIRNVIALLIAVAFSLCVNAQQGTATTEKTKTTVIWNETPAKDVTAALLIKGDVAGRNVIVFNGAMQTEKEMMVQYGTKLGYEITHEGDVIAALGGTDELKKQLFEKRIAAAKIIGAGAHVVFVKKIRTTARN